MLYESRGIHTWYADVPVTTLREAAAAQHKLYSDKLEETKHEWVALEARAKKAKVKIEFAEPFGTPSVRATEPGGRGISSLREAVYELSDRERRYRVKIDRMHQILTLLEFHSDDKELPINLDDLATLGLL